MNFRHRSIRFEVGVRPIIEGQPLLGNLRSMPCFSLAFKLEIKSMS